MHALSSVRAVENALNIVIPDTARIMRNIIAGIQQIQDHVIHFYHLHALDWVDVVSALKADPARTAELAQSVSPWPLSSKAYFRSVQERLGGFVNRGQLGPFANGYWGNPSYRLPAEANLMAVAHYLEALEWQREVIKIQALLGAKNPHAQTYLVGGMSVPVDPNSQNAVNAGTIGAMKSLAAQAREFVRKVYIPDLLAIASFYRDWGATGGTENYLCYGDHPDGAGRNFIPAGVIKKKNLKGIEDVDHGRVKEYVSRSYYEYSGEDAPRHPWDGETKPRYTGPKPPYERMFTDGASKYSWVKAPRYDDLPMEVGPLARVLVWYARGDAFVTEQVNGVLKKLGVTTDALFSTLGRTAARAVETAYFAEILPRWIDELAGAVKSGNARVHNGEKWDPDTWPKEAKGFGFHEAPRGALCHWVVIKNGAIANYQAVVPGTWNASPRDGRGQRGPYEHALIGTALARPDEPLEILRTVHSFDPCLACAVHVVHRTGKNTAKTAGTAG